MKVRKNHKLTDHNGSTFDSFLEQEGIRDQIKAAAIKRVRDWGPKQAALNKANKFGLVQDPETSRKKK